MHERAKGLMEHGLLVKELYSQSRGSVFETTGGFKDDPVPRMTQPFIFPKSIK